MLYFYPTSPKNNPLSTLCVCLNHKHTLRQCLQLDIGLVGKIWSTCQFLPCSLYNMFEAVQTDEFVGMGILSPLVNGVLSVFVQTPF